MWSDTTRQLIEAACEEDLGSVGDISSALLSNAEAATTGRVVVREPGVICGLALGTTICEVFARRLGEPLRFAAERRAGETYADGSAVARGTCVATVHGSRRAVLAVERTLLNFLGRMSGVATLTHRFVEAAYQGNPNVKVFDTRKTLPGWRELDKYAVRVAGGRNHRLGLHDAVLIKDNHLAGLPTERLAGGALRTMLNELRHGVNLPRVTGNAPQTATPAPAFVEVEVDSPEQLAEVCKVRGVDIILLDNFSVEQIRTAVALRDARGLRGELELEASGGVSLESVTEIAAAGIDRIAVGAITHSAVALDIALDL